MSDAPLTEQLDLDISAALAQLENLGSALDSLVTNFQTGMEAALDSISNALTTSTVEVPVEADTTQAVDAISALSDEQPIEIPVDADTSAAQADIGALSDEQPIEIPVDADTTTAQSEIDNLTAQTVEVPVDADTSAAASAIADLGGAQTVDVPVDADITDAQAAIDSLADTQLSLFPDADVSGAADSISALDSETVTIPVDADTSPAQAALDDLTATPIEVPVEADTSDAEAAISDLGSSADTASGGVNGLKAATTGLDAAAGAAVGSAGGLEGVISGIGPEAAAGAAGVASFAGFLKTVIPLAADAQAQTARFSETFGAFSEQVQHINVGGLNTTLEDLGKQSGTLNADLEASASKIGLFGKSAGASGEQVVQTTDNVLALAGALSVQNPRLGDASVVADKLNRALVTGGRFAQQLGLSLQAADIKTRAQEIAGAGNEVTRFDLLTAGAQLTVAQFGDTLGSTFAAGSQNAQIQLRALSVQIKETLTAIGQPLLGPLISDLQAFLPVAQALGNVFGSALQLLLPLLQAFAPLLAATATALNVVAAALNAIPTPILEAVTVILALSAALNVLLGVNALLVRGLAFLIPSLAEFATTAAEASAAATVLGGAMDIALGPIGLVVAAITAVVVSLEFFRQGAGRFHSSANTVKVDATDIATALLASANAADVLAGKTAVLDAALSQQLAKTLAVGPANQTALDGVNQLGLSFTELTKELLGTRTGFEDFTSSLALHISGTKDEQEAQIHLIDALGQTRAELEAQSEAALAAAVASGTLTQAQVDAAEQTSNGQPSLVGAVTAYEELKPAIDAAAKAQTDAAIATGALQQGFLDLKPAIADGTVTTDDAAQVAEQLGIGAEDAKAAIDSLSKSMTDFVNAGVAALPQVSAAFDDFQSHVDSAFQAVESAGGSGASSAIASATQSVASAQQAANQAVSAAGASGAAAIDAARQRVADAQARLLDTQNTGSKASQSQIDSATRAVQTANENLARAESDAADKRAAAVASGGQRVTDAENALNQAQEDQAAKSKKAQDDLLFALDPQRVIDQINANTAAIVNFQKNLVILLGRGRDDVVAQLVAQGPLKGGQLAQSFVNDDSKAKAAEAGIGLGNSVFDGYTGFLTSPAVLSRLAGRTVTLANGTRVVLSTLLGTAGEAAGNALINGVITSVTGKGTAGGITRGVGTFGEKTVGAASNAIATQAATAGTVAASAFTSNFKVAAPAGAEAAKVAPAIAHEQPVAAAQATTSSTAVSTAWTNGLTFTGGLHASFLAFETALDQEANVAAIAANQAGGRVGHAFGVGFRDALALGLTAGGPITLPTLAPTTGTTVPNVRPPTTIPTGTGPGQAHTTSTAVKTAEVNVTLHRTDPDPFQLAHEIGFAVG